MTKINKPARPVRDGSPEEQTAYWAMVGAVVARDHSRPPEFWDRIWARIHAGQSSPRNQAA